MKKQGFLKRGLLNWTNWQSVPSMKRSSWTNDFFPAFSLFINIFIIIQIRGPALTCQTILFPVFVLLAGADAGQATSSVHLHVCVLLDLLCIFIAL